MNKKLKEISKKRLAKILFIPDVHAPFHLESAWNLMMTAMKDFKPDAIIILGDFIDNYQLSSHEKDLQKRPSFKDELIVANLMLDELDKLESIEKVFICGNHCTRLNRFLSQDNFREKLLPLLDSGVIKIQYIQDLLNLKQRNWQFIPYKEHYKLGKLHATHDVGKSGPMAALDAEATFQSNAVIGHVHAMTYVVKGNMKNSPHVGVSFGWLGDLNQMEYMSKARAARNWTNGFGYGFLDADENVHIVPVPIINNTCVVNGKLYKS